MSIINTTLLRIIILFSFLHLISSFEFNELTYHTYRAIEMEEKTNYFRMDLSSAKTQSEDYLFFMIKFDSSHWFHGFGYCYSNDTNSCDDFTYQSYYYTYKKKRSYYRKDYFEVPLKRNYNYIFVKVEFSLFGLLSWYDLTVGNEDSTHTAVVASTVYTYIIIAIFVLIIVGATLIGFVKRGNGSRRLTDCVESCEDKICCCFK